MKTCIRHEQKRWHGHTAGAHIDCDDACLVWLRPLSEMRCCLVSFYLETASRVPRSCLQPPHRDIHTTITQHITIAPIAAKRYAQPVFFGDDHGKWQLAYDFLFTFSSNNGSILLDFQSRESGRRDLPRLSEKSSWCQGCQRPAPQYLSQDCYSSFPVPVVVIIFDRQSISLAQLRASVHVSSIGHCLLPDKEFETVCLHKSVSLICHLTVFTGSWRSNLLFDALATSDWLLSGAVYKFAYLLTYLLTYIPTVESSPPS